jgi:hypothetical protein
MAETEGPSERLKNLSETVKNIVLTVAVVVGGGWTLYTFRSLNQEQQSRAILTKSEADTAVANAQLRESALKTKDFALQIGLESTVHKSGRQRRIAVVATLQNPGAGPLLLTFREPAFRLARITSTHPSFEISPVSEGTPIYLTTGGASQIPVRRLLAQQSRRLPYLFDVAEPGEYLLQVGVDYRDESKPESGTFAFEQAIIRVE